MELVTVDRLGEHEELPTRSELACLRPGCFCRVQSKSGSRFWCQLTSSKRPNGTYTARLETVPAGGPDVRGGLVVLEPGHVLEII